MKTAYYLDADGNHLAVTTETPKGPLKGFVFVGKRIVGSNDPTEEAFGIDQIAKFKKLEIGDVPVPILEAFGYDEPPAPPVVPPPVEAHDEAHDEAHEPAHDEGVKSRPVHYGAEPISCLPIALTIVWFVAAVTFFYWLKHS